MGSKELKLKSPQDILTFLKINIPFIVLFSILVFFAYAYSLNGEFVSDDIPTIINNPEVTNLTTAFKSLYLQSILRSITYTLFGLNTVFYHLQSVVLHIINLALFFTVTYMLFGKRTSVIATVLFSVHPTASEAVIWLSGVNYIILSIATNIILISYLLYKETNNKKYLHSTYLLYLVSLISVTKIWVYIIPFIVLIVEWLILPGTPRKKTLANLSGLFVLAMISFAIVFAQNKSYSQRIESLAVAGGAPYIKRLPYSIYMPLELLVFPKNLTLYHEGEIITATKYNLMIITSIGLLVITLISLVKKDGRGRNSIAGKAPEQNKQLAGFILLIYASLLPVLSPLQVSWFVADRYLYFATGIFCIVLGILIKELEKELYSPKVAVAATSIVFVILLGRTLDRNADWKTQKSVWLATEKVGPNGPRVHNNLGDIYAREGDLSKSIWHFERAIQLDPTYSDAMHNLGNTYIQTNEIEKAKELYIKSLEYNPYLYQSLYKIGLIEYQSGNHALGQEYIQKSLQIAPDYEQAKATLVQMQSQ